jgi:TrmH family RNA methyltransferase
VITSADNQQLKTVRKLHERSWRDKLGQFIAEGEDLVAAADAAGWAPVALLRAGEDVEPELLDSVSTLGSGTRVIGIYEQRWAEPGGELSVYLHGVGDPGNVGAVIRSAHALADGPVLLGPGCADPWSPKAVRASMGSVFARPPARGEPAHGATVLGLDPHAERALADAVVEPPVVLALGAEREGLPAGLGGERARIELRPDGPESLNVAAAAAIALHDLSHRITRHA